LVGVGRQYTRDHVRSKIKKIRSNSQGSFYDPNHFLESYTDSPYYKIKAGQYRLVIDWRKRDGDEDVFFVRTIATAMVSTVLS